MALGFDKASASRDNSLEAEVDSLLTEGSGTPNSTKKLDKKLIIAIVVVVLLGALILVGVFMGGKEGEETQSSEQQQAQSEQLQTEQQVQTDSQVTDGQTATGNGVYDANGNTIDPNGVNPGIPNYSKSENNTTVNTVYSANDYIKDLNGLDISAIYNVERREYIQDYIVYETRRAITADGMELYWLEATYNNKPYRVQVPFYYFKDLGTDGICKVEIELLHLVGGGKVISYMQVIQDE